MARNFPIDGAVNFTSGPTGTRIIRRHPRSGARVATDDDALKLWRRAIEAHGVFVFKDSFKQGAISGFCLRHDEFPIILINNSTTKTRQTFSLLHELFLLFNRSGISRLTMLE